MDLTGPTRGPAQQIYLAVRTGNTVEMRSYLGGSAILVDRALKHLSARRPSERTINRSARLSEPSPTGMPTMKVLPKINATGILLAFSLVCGVTISRASAEPMHTPTKMPMAKAESVGMSTEGLNRIDEVMQEHIDAGHIQGAVTAVARRGKVVHFSTHGEMDVKKGREMEPDAIFRMASSTKPVLALPR